MTEKNAETPIPPQSAAVKKSRRTSWTAWGLAIVMIFLTGAGSMLYFLPFLKDRLPVIDQWLGEDNSLMPEITSLKDRLDQQEAGLQTLKAAEDDLVRRLDTLSSAAPAEADPALLTRLDRLEKTVARQAEKKTAEKKTEDISQSARIDMLLGRMSQLEASFVPLSKGLSDAQDARQERARLGKEMAAQAGRLDRVESRLDKVERYAARDNNGALLAFRIGELRRKITSGQAFGPEISNVKAMISQGSMALNEQLQDSLGWFERHKDGISPPGRLRTSFDALIPALIRAKSAHAHDPWWKRAYNSTRNLVIIRKTARADSTDSDSLIATAQKMLADFDLKDALDRLRQLPQNMRDQLTAWRAQAEIYLQAEDQLERIESLTASYYLSPPPKKAEEKTPEKKNPDQESAS